MSLRYPATYLPELIAQFVAYVQPISNDPATPPHTLRVSVENHEAEILFPAQASDGFDVRISVDRVGVRIHSGKLVHAHIDHTEDPKGAIEAAFGMARDLLSPNMRLRERYAGSRVIWACVERFDGTHWHRAYDTGLMLFNYFRRRQERTFTNRQLPGRTFSPH